MEMVALRALRPWLIWPIAFGLSAWFYLPGLQGGFLFDDYANLPTLGATGPVTHWDTFWRYITSGTADPTGRPLSLLSFLIDARDWPAEPWPFKRTNLALHLINGLLLILLLKRLGRARCTEPTPSVERRLDLAAALGGAFWLLHPLFVSTTLYIVQREAMLPATFTLLGLLAWLQGRSAFAQGKPTRGAVWLLTGLGLCTALAIASKANGVLLPALVLTVEIVFFAENHSPAAWRAADRSAYRRLMLVLAGIPSLLIAGYLAFEGWRGLTHGLGGARPWTLGQRLLTEPRVLMDYLKLLWLPRPFTTGLFNDQYVVSTSLWQPVTTLPALLGVIALWVAAWVLRRRAPAVALALAFYFVGQSMESSTLALELYFEHRNYLPALLMFWPLSLWLCGLKMSATGTALFPLTQPAIRLRGALALAVLAGLGWMTHARADLWGNAQDQALLWARLNPNSPRAQAFAAQAEMQAGHPERAVARLRPALAQRPDEVQLALNLLAARCQQGHLDAGTLHAALQALRTTRDTGTLLASWFNRAIDQSAAPACPELDLATLEQLLQAAQSNPRLVDLAGRRQDLYHLQGRIALARQQPQAALAAFNTALDQQVRPEAAFQQAALLGSAHQPALALAHLDHYEAERDREEAPAFGMPRIHAWVLRRQRYWDNELLRLRQTLRDDLRPMPSPSP